MTEIRKTNAGRWSSSGSTRDLPTIAFIRAAVLLRRNGPVPGILAAHRPGAIMDKSGRRFVRWPPKKHQKTDTNTPSVKNTPSRTPNAFAELDAHNCEVFAVSRQSESSSNVRFRPKRGYRPSNLPLRIVPCVFVHRRSRGKKGAPS